jgi:polyisoprenyl-phosphate glycosyltransferase
MRLSVLIPFYNEAAGVADLFARLLPVLDGMAIEAEVLCIDDGSRDATLARLLEAQARDSRLVILRLSRNFGKEAAMTAGLEHASGDAVMILDADLQHPPELIPKFLETLNSGFDMVYGVRRDRKTDGPVRGAFSNLFYRLMARSGDVPVPKDAGDFRILSRRAVAALNRLHERGRFMKGLFAWIGFPQTSLEFDVEPRRHGGSTWSALKLAHYAWDGVVSFTSLPLRTWSVMGLVIAALSGGYAIWIVVDTLRRGADVPGYPSIVTSIFFLAGIQLLSIGEYVARIFNETKQRPVYIIENVFRAEGARTGG